MGPAVWSTTLSSIATSRYPAILPTANLRGTTLGYNSRGDRKLVANDVGNRDTLVAEYYGLGYPAASDFSEHTPAINGDTVREARARVSRVTASPTIQRHGPPSRTPRARRSSGPLAAATPVTSPVPAGRYSSGTSIRRTCSSGPTRCCTTSPAT